MKMTQQRWEATHRYLGDVFGREDDVLIGLADAARREGLPDISVGPVVGRLLMMLASMVPPPKDRPCKSALEIGTLGGYSAIWIARGLRRGGRLVTVEVEPRYADFARRWFREAGLADRIDLRRGAALDLLPEIAKEVGEGGLDLLFLDAVKTEYPEYWRIARPLIAEGGCVVIDNALGSGSWWIDAIGHPNREAADAVNRALADDPDFVTVGVPLRQGVVLARRVERAQA